MIPPKAKVSACARRPVRRAADILIALLVLGPGAAPILAQPAEKLPAAAAVLDRYVEVTGGAAAYARLNNRKTTGTVEMVGQGLKGTLTTCSARPAKLHSLVEIEGIGTIEKGTDGKVVWEKSVLLGPQIKEGDEKALLLRSAFFDGTVNWRKVFKKAECQAVEAVDGKPCYKLVLTAAEGPAETRYYDKQSGLLVKVAFDLETPMGVIPVESYFDEYKRVDGVLIPHQIRQVVLGMQETRIVLQRVEHNVEMPKDRFELPAEIRALLEKPKASQPAKHKP